MAQSSSQARSQAGAQAWFSNAMKSVGRASVESFKKIAPNVSSVGTGMYEGGRKVRSSLRPTSLIGISRDLSKNKYVKIAKKTLGQSLKDIKTGNLYNPDRAAEAYLGGGDDFDFSGFGDDDFGNGEDGGDNFFISNSSSDTTGAATFAVTNAIGKSAETTVAVGGAVVDTMMGMSSAVISEIQSGFGEVSSKLATVNSTLEALLEFHNQNTTKFYETVLSSLNRVTPAEPQQSFGTPDANPMAVFGSKGGVNFSSYKDYIKKQMKRVVENSPAGMVMGMLDENTIEMLFADPVGGLTNTIVTAMVPNVVERTLKTVDKTLGDLEQNMLIDLGKWAKDPSKNFVQQMIGSIFGIHPDEVKRSTSMASINKDAAVFDNITRNTLVEVLPKYARESTAYLKEIAMHVTKKDEKALISKADVFDATNNRYVKQDKLMKEFLSDLSNNITGTFKSTEFGEAINSISGNLSGKDKESFDKTFNQFIAKLATSDHNFTYRDFNVDDKNSPIYQLLKNTGNKRDRALLREAFKYMYDNGQAGGAARAQQDARTAWNNQVKELSENYDVHNLHALGIDNTTDLVSLLLNYQDGQLDKISRVADKTRNNKKARNAFGKNQNIRDIVSGSISGWEESEDMFNSDRKLSGGQIANKLFGAEFGQGFKEMGGHAVGTMQQIMKGNTQGAMAEFSKIFTGQMKNMWEGAKTHFIKPLSEKLYGKDADGKAIGLFAGTRNKLNDTYKAVLQKINGKDYEDSKGNIHKAEEGTSLVDKAADVFNTVKTSVVKVLFGDKVKTDKDGNPIEGAKTGVFSKITDTMKAGIQGWKEAVFGESENPDEEIANIKKKALDHLPSAIGGGAGGAFIGAMAGGSLFGTLIGGPVGGAAIGFASSFLFKSDKFKDYLFGPEVEDENGKRRIGGLISEKTQKIFKENKNSIIGGAALGALKSIVFPNSVGLMANIVGGPIAGAAIGAGVGLLKKSDAFQKFLYGDEESGKEGVVTAFRKMFKKDGKSNPEMDKENMKSIGMGITGAGAGAITASLVSHMGILGAMATPAGPLGGAIVGAAVGIAAGGRKFREFLFGKKDPDTGDKKGGLFQKFGNFLHVEILAPMKSKVQGYIDDAMITFKYDVLETIRLPFTLMANKMSEKLGNVKDFIHEKVGGAIMAGFKTASETLAKPFMKFIFDPARKILGKTTDILYNFGKMTILAPFRMVRLVGKAVTSKISKAIGKVTSLVTKGVFWTFKKIGGAIRGVSKIASWPFRKIGSLVSNMKDRAAEKYSGGGGGIRGGLYRLGAKLTSSEWRRGDYENQAEKLEQKKQAKADARKRAIADYNRRLVARELGYDVKYFTESSMNEAIEHAKLNHNKRLKFKGNGVGQDISQYFDTDPAEERKKILEKSTAEISRNGDRSPDIDIRQLTEQHRTNELLEQILGNIPESPEDDDEFNRRAQEYAREHGFEYDPVTKQFKYMGHDDDETEDSGNNDEEETPKKRRSLSEWVRGYTQDVADAGGYGKYFANTVRDGLNGIRDNIKEGYNGSWLQGVVGKFKSSGHTRAAGGPINEGEPYIVGEGGNDMSGAELIVPRQSGTVLAQGGDGIKVFVKDFDSVSLARLRDVISTEDQDQESILTQTLKVIEDLAEDIPVIGHSLSKVIGIANERLRGSQFNSDINDQGLLGAVSSRLPFGGPRAAGGAVAPNRVYLVGDGGKDPQAKEFFVPTTSGKILSQGKTGIKVEIVGVSDKGKRDLESVAVGGRTEKSGNIIESMRAANTYTAMKEKAAELKEQESDNKREIELLNTVKEIKDKNKEHHSIWNSIFSKRGIFTLGAIALGGVVIANLPKIVDFVKGFKPVLDRVKEAMDWFLGNRASEDGKGAAELAADEASQIVDAGSELLHGNIPEAASQFILDNGRYDANSGGRAAFLANIARKPLRAAIKVGSSVVKGGTAVVKGAGNLAVKGASAFGRSALGRAAISALPQTMQQGIYNIGRKQAAKQIESTIAKGLAEKGAAKLASGVAQNGAEAVAKSSKGLLPKVLGMLDDFISALLKKVGAKMPNVLKNVMKKVTSCVTKHFPKITAKISSALGIKGGAEAATFGISAAVFITAGAINGATGAARLFKIDKDNVDAIMTLISTVMGGLLTGTVTGSIIDIIAGLIYEVLGFDFLGTVAMILYQALTGSEASEKLATAQKEWEAEFLSQRDKKLEDELSVQQAAGIVGRDVTLEQFKEGVFNGQYSARIDSMQDWNAEQNQTIGYKIGKGFTKGWQGVKKFWSGSNRYTDANGQQYIDNGDGTLTVIDANGKELGKISKDAVDVSSMTNDHKKGAGDYVKNAGKTIVNGAKTAFTAVGKGIGNVATYGVDFVKGIGTGVKTIVQNFANPDIDLIGYFKSDVNSVSEDNPLHGVASAILNTSKFMMLPKLAVAGTLAKVSKAVVDGIKGAVSGVAKFAKNTTEAIKGYSTGKRQIQTNFDNPDMDVMDYFRADVNTVSESNPFHDFVGGVLTVNKFVQFPVLMMSGLLKQVGKAIFNKVTGVVNNTKSAWNALHTDTEKLHKVAFSGDIEGLNNYQVSIPENTPMSGIVKGIATANKFIMYPVAGVAWAGKKVFGNIKNTARKTAQVVGAIGSNYISLASIENSGDLEGLNAWEPTVEDGTPISGVVKGISYGMKYISYPSTIVHWTGRKIAERIRHTFDKVKAVTSSLDSNDDSLDKLASAGDLEGLNAWEPTVEDGTPISGVVEGISYGMKLIHYPGTAVHFATNKVSEKIRSIAKGFAFGRDTISNYSAKLMEYEDIDKDMAEFDKEKMLDTDNPVAGVIESTVQFIIKPIVMFKRAISSVGRWIKDKFGDVADWIMGIFDKGKDIANGEYDDDKDDGSEEGGSGSRKFGGRGPSTMNGAAYFSQEDPRWANKSYTQGVNDGATIGDTGCAPASMAMVARQLGQGDANPVNMANLASAGGYRDQTGTNQKYVDYAANKLGFEHSSAYDPSAAYIQDQASRGNPVLLNGISAGESGSPYTDAGHYVVAVGTDSSGRIIVNDPRGPQYSTAYDPKYLASETRKAWSFGKRGGNGRGLKRLFGGRGPIAADASPTSASTTGKPSFASSKLFSEAVQTVTQTGVNAINGINGDWVSIVREVKALIAEQQPIYWTEAGSHMHQINYHGHTYNVRPDCSGIIACMLWIYGVLPEGTNVTSATLHNKGAIPKGFDMIDFPGWEGLKEGDIIVKSGHVEIFANNNGGKHYVYNGGSTKSLRSAGPTVSGGGQYTIAWRPKMAGSGAFFQGLRSNMTPVGSNNYSSGSYSSGRYDASSGSSTGNSFLDKLSRAGSVLTNAASKALDGIFTGKWDFNVGENSSSSDGSYSSSTGYSAASSSPSAGNIDVSGYTVQPIKLSGNADREKIYNHLRSKYSPEAASSVMGCWEIESRNTPSRVEGDYLKNYWGHDRVLKDNESMNDYTTNFLFPAYDRSKNKVSYTPEGYKMSDGNYYPGVGLAQWTGPRGKALSDFAKANGMKWGDLETQLQFFDNEMNNKYDKVQSNLKSVETVEDGTRVMLDGYEMSSGYSSKQPSQYQKRLNAAKAIYNEFGGKGQGSNTLEHTNYPKIDTTSGRLNASNSSTTEYKTYSVSQQGIGGDMEKMIRKMVSLLEDISGITEPIRAISENTRVLNGIGGTLDSIAPRVGAGSTNNITNNINRGGSSGGSGMIKAGSDKNARLAQQIARGV